MVRAVSLSPISMGRRRPNQVAAWIRFTPSMSAANQRQADRSAAAKRLQMLLAIKHGWMRVPAVAQCVESLARLGAERAITPRVFKAVLREANASMLEPGPARAQQLFGKAFVLNLLEVEAFLASKTLSWQTISDYGASLAARSRRKHDYFVSLGQLMVIARSINTELEWARPAAVPTFCGMCWRFTMTDRKYCPMHSPVAAAAEGGGGRRRETGNETIGLGGTYWSARKLLPMFEAQVRTLRGVDRKQLLRSSWRDFAAHGDVSLWLLMHRPHVYGVVASNVADVGPDAAIPALVQALDSVPGESRQERNARRVFHGYLEDDAAAVFDMVLRAEAWLSAANERTSRWGGARAGAGRPALKCAID
jgi:hypothetical protein